MPDGGDLVFTLSNLALASGQPAPLSDAGQGTIFSIYLPRHESALAKKILAPLAEDRVPGDGKTILLTEDNAALRMAVGDSLEMFGYRVLVASDGHEALKILADQGSVISLLISDLVMPQMGGMELTQLVAADYPAIKVLIMTGHPLNMSQAALAQAGIHGWIEKPFSIDALFDQIRRILGGKGKGEGQ